MDGLRLGAVRVSAELMYQLFRASRPGEWFRVDKGLPTDVEYVRSYYDDRANHFVFVYTHPTFPLTRPGELVVTLPDVTVSALHLTSPLDSTQCEVVERLINAQSRAARDAEGK